MNIIESYAATSGLRIRKPFILQKFFPLAIQNFITIQPYSKQSKSYDYWSDVVDIIKPILDKQNINIIQIGGKDEKPINGAYFTQGQTSINEVAYILKHSKLHVGADSFAAHLAGIYNLPLVALYSNNYMACVRPYWGDKSRQILLESHRNGMKPSFSFSESPKTINLIKPEQIAQAILNLLGLNETIKYKSLYFGEKYSCVLIENIPDQVIDIGNFGVDCIIERMDLLFDENVLLEQLRKSPVSIVTNKPINKNIILQFKDRVRELIFELTEENHSDFLEFLCKTGIKHVLVTELKDKSLNDAKLIYMETEHILNKHNEDLTEKIEKFKQIPNLFYKSAKLTLSQGQIYPSLAAWKFKKPVDTKGKMVHSVIYEPEFWDELESFQLLTKN